tara:strand:+ start:464 stop:1435 length:972 start_codon:yes stop_codon:yes gene_type:complete
MYKYTIARILLLIPTVIGAGIIVFFLIRLIPGDICVTRWVDFGTDLDPSLLQSCRDHYGLNDPLLVQFGKFFLNILSLDFGMSMWTGNSMAVELGSRFALSFQVAFMALFFTVAVGLPLGVVAAKKHGSLIDKSITAVSILGVAVPSFWVGILCILGILILSQKLLGNPWMPPIIYVSPIEDLGENLSQLLLPAVAVGVRYLAITVRMTRSAMLEVLEEDYIRTARSQGISEPIIARRHALRNALLPIVTVLSAEFAFLIGGLVVTEQVFNLNGIGALLVQALIDGDYVVVQTLVMLIALVFALVNLIVDLIYSWLDPRIRYD